MNKLSFPRPKELSLIDPVVSDEEMFENVDKRTTDGRTDDGVTGLQLAFGSGELKSKAANSLSLVKMSAKLERT